MRTKRTYQQPEGEALSLQTLLTIKAVADLLNVTRPTIYTLIDKEGLPVMRLGRSVRFSPRSLQQWLIDHEEIG